MASIDEIILREANPFDPVTFKTGNFWQDDSSNAYTTVESIHQEAIVQITQMLDTVATDHRTRTVMLAGDAGAGKSYVLNRLKHLLNSKAFFVYIDPFKESDHIWRHTLRRTVDSLMNKPEGQEDSQLLLWLKSLPVFQDHGFMKKLLGERGLFINNFRSTYPVGIHQAKEFFSALYSLTQPDLYLIACDWLRGEDLDEEDLKALGVKKSIDSETFAQGILSNFGRISTSTYPIVLCFDQIESKLLPDGTADIQPIFVVNTTFHADNLKNFLIIISIVSDTWKQNQHRIQQADKDRVEKLVLLKRINLDQAEAIWASRLYPLHLQADPKPESSIFPLSRQALEQKFPGGKTTPRFTLTLGQNLFLEYKSKIIGHEIPPPDVTTSFKLLWAKELKKTKEKVTRIRHFSSLDLATMLREAIAALNVEKIQHKFLPSPTYSRYSFAYQQSIQTQKNGIVWAEEPSLNSFYNIMKACQKANDRGSCQKLYLVRAETIGRNKHRGYQLCNQIFNGSPHVRLIPDLNSVHYLATYDRLVNSASAQELVLGGKTITLSELEMLVRESKVLHDCLLLQQLGVVPKGKVQPDPVNPSLEDAKKFLLDFVKIHHVIAQKTVAQNVHHQFSDLNDEHIQSVIQRLCQDRKIRILDENAPEDEKIICLIPQSA
jgi:hypothetical protein